MLGAVKRHVDEWLARQGSRPAAARLACLDSSKGAVDGVIWLVFPDGAAAPSLVAKAAHTARGRAIFDADYRNLETLERAGFNAGSRRAPEPLGRFDADGLLVTLQSALAGTLLKNVPGRRLFGRARAAATVATVLDWWRQLQRSCPPQRTCLSGATYERAVLAPVERFLSRFETTAAERTLLDQRFAGRRALEGVELPWMVRHGDLCPANIVQGAGGLAVFDWEFPLEHGPPLFDLFYFLSSTRQPYRGLRGESGHFASFLATWWGGESFAATARATVAAACAEHGVPPACVADLFLLALVEVAGLKLDGFAAAAGLDPAAADRATLWRRLGDPDTDEPFARIRAGRLENLAAVAQRSLPLTTLPA